MDIQLQNKSNPAYKNKFYFFVSDCVRDKQICFKIEAVELVGEFNEKWLHFVNGLGLVSDKKTMTPSEFAEWYNNRTAEGWKVFVPSY